MAAEPAVHRGMPELVNPALVEHARERANSFNNRLADRITTFAGSMRFVWMHAIWFTLWIALGVEAYPSAC
ncbi:MAG TPA: hypothetical protein VFU10_00145 [Gaiellaceae bacterium]|nr:hypothetical protein [Gaiellaceae bacterium]